MPLIFANSNLIQIQSLSLEGQMETSMLSVCYQVAGWCLEGITLYLELSVNACCCPGCVTVIEIIPALVNGSLCGWAPAKPPSPTHGHSVHVPIQTLESLMSEDG